MFVRLIVFIRFVVDEKDEESLVPVGVFHALRKRKAISWFKDTATEHLRRIRDVCAILEHHDVRVRMITTDRPGYILYEDEFQVAAEPFADTPI